MYISADDFAHIYNRQEDILGVTGRYSENGSERFVCLSVQVPNTATGGRRFRRVKLKQGGWESKVSHQSWDIEGSLVAITQVIMHELHMPQKRSRLGRLPTHAPGGRLVDLGASSLAYFMSLSAFSPLTAGTFDRGSCRSPNESLGSPSRAENPLIDQPAKIPVER
ncbi:hypothetical protein PM082_015731 [Marasmius tenuissimus]|nr:hypothetical protein PM082_015731 [Marasmius tenuissimus]